MTWVTRAKNYVRETRKDLDCGAVKMQITWNTLIFRRLRHRDPENQATYKVFRQGKK